MSTRRQAREWVVQLLFELDLNPRNSAKAFRDFFEEHEADPRSKRFTQSLIEGVRENVTALDETIRACAEHWDMRRMGVIERNVLRMAVYEMLYRDDIPPVVSINEAVDLAKFFSSTESGRFVNGILDRVRKDLDRPARTPRKAAKRVRKRSEEVDGAGSSQ